MLHGYFTSLLIFLKYVKEEAGSLIILLNGGLFLLQLYTIHGYPFVYVLMTNKDTAMYTHMMNCLIHQIEVSSFFATADLLQRRDFPWFFCYTLNSTTMRNQLYSMTMQIL